MVIQYNKKYFDDMCLFVKENYDEDFYITENNRRIIINNSYLLKGLLNSSNLVFISEENNIVNGILSVWASCGSDIKRKYIKLLANEYIADKLLTVLFWNSNEDFYIKINKNSEMINVLRRKGFEFFHDRGNELLLVRRNRQWITH